MSESQQVNPYAAPQHVSVDAPVFTSTGKIRYRFAIGLSALVVVGAFMAAVAAAFDIESIIFSGPVLCTISLILIAIARHEILHPLMWLSGATILMSCGCLATIFFQEWTPAQAQTPISIAIGVFAAIFQAGWIVIFVVRNRHRSTQMID